MNTNTKQYEYVIGIDLGHGETSAAICPLQWDTPVEQLDTVKDLEMGGNKKVIPSAITILDDGRAYIGDAAFNSEILKLANVRVCFKQAPQNIDGEAERIMIRFMQEVYKRIRENNSAMLTDANHLVYIATPSGWDNKTQELYVEMARKAGIPMGGITKESRAAFVRAQHDATSGLGRNIHNGAIVFDMGSSTLDFTYMNSTLKGLIDYGYDCGASHVEKSIFAELEKEDDAIKLFERKYPRLVDYLVFEARKVKEQVYFDPSLRVKKTIYFDDIIEDEELKDERFKLLFKPGELNEFLNENGYIGNIENAMLDYRKNYIPNEKIYGVFLTGGASRMDFIKPLVCKCWGVDENQVYRDQDPSLTISQGVAEVARMDLRTSGMDKGLEEQINALQNSSEIYEKFVNNFGAAIYNAITQNIENTVTQFKDSEADLSINDLKNAISEDVRNVVSQASECVTDFIQEAITESVQDISEKVENIISHYRSQGMEVNIDINALDVSTVKLPNINLNNIMNDISLKIASQSNNWSSYIGGAAIGAAAAILFGGPLAWLIGGGAILGRKLFGDSEAEKRRKAMDCDLNIENRIKVYNSIGEEWENITNDIATSINDALTGNHEIKNSINNIVYSLLQSYKDNLKNARILID